VPGVGRCVAATHEPAGKPYQHFLASASVAFGSLPQVYMLCAFVSCGFFWRTEIRRDQVDPVSLLFFRKLRCVILEEGSATRRVAVEWENSGRSPFSIATVVEMNTAGADVRTTQTRFHVYRQTFRSSAALGVFSLFSFLPSSIFFLSSIFLLPSSSFFFHLVPREMRDEIPVKCCSNNILRKWSRS